MGWQSASAALYFSLFSAQNDAMTVHQLTVKDVPVVSP
jgi:hypothetical protein